MPDGRPVPSTGFWKLPARALFRLKAVRDLAFGNARVKSGAGAGDRCANPMGKR